MASSRRRAIQRASSSPATLAHAISSTKPVATASIQERRSERAAALFAQRVHAGLELDVRRPTPLICGTVEDRAHLGRGLLRRHPRAAGVRYC